MKTFEGKVIQIDTDGKALWVLTVQDSKYSRGSGLGIINAYETTDKFKVGDEVIATPVEFYYTIEKKEAV